MSITVSQTAASTQKVLTFEQLEPGRLYKINGIGSREFNEFDHFLEVYTKIGDSLVYFPNNNVNVKRLDSTDRFIEAPKGTTVTLTND